MKIAVLGLGYVGLTTAACLAHTGHEIIGIDINEEKVVEINSGRSPIMEPGLSDLIAAAVGGGRLRCTTNGTGELAGFDMAIVCVGTPTGPDGSHNMSYIAEVSRQLATIVRPDRSAPLTIVYRSTIRPGTTEELIEPIFRAILGEEGLEQIRLVYSPEFMREATAVKDFFAPPKIVVGTKDGLKNEFVDEMNRNINAPLFYTSYREAELTKFVDNTFHALKVSFANEIGRLCLQLGISVAKVHEIFVSDTKLNISPYYLKPGGAFGGSCLPKDVRALQHLSSDIGANTHLIDSVIRSNEAHKHYLYQHAVRGLSPGSSILMIGLAFKVNSDDLRESPKVDLARKLLQSGYSLSIYDPDVRPSQLIGANLGYAFSHLPRLLDLLISREELSKRTFDLVIDTCGIVDELSIAGGRIINFHALA